MRVTALSGVAMSLCLAAWAAADEGHQHEQGEKLGKVDFPVTCNAVSQAAFQRGVALLHSFQYEDAEKAFADLAAADPACAMAYWGTAMSLYQPVWAAANPSAAPTPEKLRQGAEAEKDYIDAVEAFYKDAEKLDHPTRALAFERAMEQLSLKYPKDNEASIFYAVALLGNAPPTDKTYARQKKAAEILNLPSPTRSPIPAPLPS